MISAWNEKVSPELAAAVEVDAMLCKSMRGEVFWESRSLWNGRGGQSTSHGTAPDWPASAVAVHGLDLSPRTVHARQRECGGGERARCVRVE